MTDKKNWIKSSQRPTKKEVEEIVNDLDGTEKENTWQTVYEQLQEILHKCIELWRLNKIFDKWCYVLEDWVYRDKWRIPMFSFHDLFSKDSGIMEFVEWEDKNLPNWYYITMCWMTWEEKVKRFVNNAIIPTK